MAAGAAIGLTLALLSPVMRAVGRESGAQVTPKQETAASLVVRRAVQLEQTLPHEHDWLQSTRVKLSVWDEVATWGSAGAVGAEPGRDADGRVTLIMQPCVYDPTDWSQTCDDPTTLVASLHDGDDSFRSSVVEHVAEVHATMRRADGSSCTLDAAFAGSHQDGTYVQRRAATYAEARTSLDGRVAGSCLESPFRSYGEVWERYDWNARAAATGSLVLPRSVEIVAGIGRPADGGDGREAKGAGLSGPQDVAVDAAGNVHIADKYLRWVTPQGIIHSRRSLQCDDGHSWCLGVATGSDGSLAVAGYGTISRIAPDGAVEPVAKPDGGAIQDVATLPDGRIVFSERKSSAVYRIEGDGSLTRIGGTGENGCVRGPADGALCAPGELATDASGNVYVIEQSTGRIKKIAPSGATTVVLDRRMLPSESPTGDPASVQPAAIAVGVDQKLYVLATTGSLYRLEASGVALPLMLGMMHVFDEGSADISGAVPYGTGLAIDDLGRFVVADAQYAYVKRITL